MTEHFRIEPVEDTSVVKVYARDSAYLPIKFDCNKRFGVLQNHAADYLEKIRAFEVRKDDVWVISAPKSGTTWMLELVWLLQNDLDFEKALTIDQEYRVPFLEICIIVPPIGKNNIDIYAEMPSPRVIKTHLPIHLLPKDIWTVKPKIVYVARNPKDAIISFYHHHVMFGTFNGSKEDFINLMLDNKIRYAPYGEQALDFWQLRNEPNIYFTSFERMKKDLRLVTSTLSKFLGKSIDDETKMAALLEHLSFDKMKDNPKCNHVAEIKLFREHFKAESQDVKNFVRKGEVGSYKSELREEVKQRVEKWHEEQLASYGVTAEEIFLS